MSLCGHNCRTIATIRHAEQAGFRLSPPLHQLGVRRVQLEELINAKSIRRQSRLDNVRRSKFPRYSVASDPSNTAIRSLAAYDNNPRRHPEKQIVKLMAPISEFGFALPVLVDAERIIIAGHARIEAARRLQIEQVPVLIANDWSKAKSALTVLPTIGFRISSTWDDELLAVELSALIELDEVPIELLGWETAEIDVIIDGQGTPTNSRIPLTLCQSPYRFRCRGKTTCGYSGNTAALRVLAGAERLGTADGWRDGRDGVHGRALQRARDGSRLRPWQTSARRIRDGVRRDEQGRIHCLSHPVQSGS